MEKNTNNIKRQGHDSVKSAVTFEQRQAPNCNFEQRLAEIKSLRILLHPARDKHGSTKKKNKRKIVTPTTGLELAPKKLKAKDEIDTRKRERQQKKFV